MDDQVYESLERLNRAWFEWNWDRNGYRRVNAHFIEKGLEPPYPDEPSEWVTDLDIIHTQILVENGLAETHEEKGVRITEKGKQEWADARDDVLPEYEEVGTIGVDAGLCWVGDPCYILHKDGEMYGSLPKSLGNDWGEFCDKLWGNEDDQRTTQFNYDAGHAGLGVCVSTGYGDGSYPVLVRRTREGRIAEVRVIFIPDENEFPEEGV